MLARLDILSNIQSKKTESVYYIHALTIIMSMFSSTIHHQYHTLIWHHHNIRYPCIFVDMKSPSPAELSSINRDCIARINLVMGKTDKTPIISRKNQFHLLVNQLHFNSCICTIHTCTLLIISEKLISRYVKALISCSQKSKFIADKLTTPTAQHNQWIDVNCNEENQTKTTLNNQYIKSAKRN